MAPRIELLPFQSKTVQKVEQDLAGSAIIADEVGLGKTIEAGQIICDELRRSSSANVLVCVPKALLYQWRAELLHKFDLLFDLEEELPDLRLSSASRNLRVLVTHSSLSAAPPDHPLSRVQWCLMVVDEAHRFSNPISKRYKELRGFKRNATLLLTATPVQNSLLDLYWLSELVRPGVLSHSKRDFVTSFTLDPKALVARQSRRSELRALLGSVLVRSTREGTGLRFPPREVHSIVCEPTEWEREARDCVQTLLRELSGGGTVAGRGAGLGRGTILQGLSSHPGAALESLERMSQTGDSDQLTRLRLLVERGKATSKMLRLNDAIQSAGGQESWLVFVERLATGSALLANFERTGQVAGFYQGGLQTADRERLVQSFKDSETKILVSTSAGSEGLNLQTCRNVVNFDLHWNPLRMEQRIGRVHRIGQTRTVRIFNLVTSGSVDEIVLDRLYIKLDLFQATVGQIATILSSFEEDFDPESDLRRALETAPDLGAFAKGVGRVAQRISDRISRERSLETAQPF
jgi:SNF2 family DNA or RNA helicase